MGAVAPRPGLARRPALLQAAPADLVTEDVFPFLAAGGAPAGDSVLIEVS